MIGVTRIQSQWHATEKRKNYIWPSQGILCVSVTWPCAFINCYHFASNLPISPVIGIVKNCFCYGPIEGFIKIIKMMINQLVVKRIFCQKVTWSKLRGYIWIEWIVRIICDSKINGGTKSISKFPPDDIAIRWLLNNWGKKMEKRRRKKKMEVRLKYITHSERQVLLNNFFLIWPFFNVSKKMTIFLPGSLKYVPQAYRIVGNFHRSDMMEHICYYSRRECNSTTVDMRHNRHWNEPRFCRCCTYHRLLPDFGGGQAKPVLPLFGQFPLP